MENFTPVSSAVGGMMIGLAVMLLWLGLGRIAGISGIVGGVVSGVLPGVLRDRPSETGWRVAFLAGLLAAPLLFDLTGNLPAQMPVAGSTGLLILAGLLVGFGTRLGSGCTSGHGVCGLARLSPRSLVATGLFMTTAAATVFLVRHVVGG
jgi:uncharacterized membrane protein YedE/YeeE